LNQIGWNRRDMAEKLKTKLWLGNTRGRWRYMGLVLDGWITLKLIFKKYGVCEINWNDTFQWRNLFCDHRYGFFDSVAEGSKWAI
jgi:hypothetical protein